MFIACAMLFASTATMAQDTQEQMNYLSCDFSKGIPTNFATYDVDQQTLHYSMVQSGFVQGQSWIAKKEMGKQNFFAASACRYKQVDDTPLQPSDDWMILPCIWVRGNNATLSWNACSFTNMKNEGCGYEILISTTGNTPADFTQPAIYTVTEEAKDEWASHQIDLSTYYGQTIYIAFHNNSATGELLGIDNILITGHKGICDINIANGTHIFGSETFYIEGSITSFSESPIDQVTIFFENNGETYSQPLNDININKYETYNFRFDQGININNGDTITYKVWAEVEGVLYETINKTAIGFKFSPSHKVVIEEGTGMWCSFCTSGIYAFEVLEKKYPNNFVGIAIHQNDELELLSYFNTLGFTGLPTGWINRKNISSPTTLIINDNGEQEYVTTHGGFETYFVEELNNLPAIDVFMQSAGIENNILTINTTVHAAIDLDNLNYKIEYALIEDDVWKNGYYQQNGYSGDDAKIGGYENLPPTITKDFMFQHVARAYYNKYPGIDESVPTTLIAGEEYTKTYTFEVPTTILSQDNLHLVAMIIDCNTGYIVNANVSGTAAAVNEVTSAQTLCYASHNGINIQLPNASKAQINIYSISGALVGSHNATSQLTTIPAHSGAYIVQIIQDNISSAHKVIVK